MRRATPRETKVGSTANANKYLDMQSKRTPADTKDGILAPSESTLLLQPGGLHQSVVLASRSRGDVHIISAAPPPTYRQHRYLLTSCSRRRIFPAESAQLLVTTYRTQVYSRRGKWGRMAMLQL